MIFSVVYHHKLVWQKSQGTASLISLQLCPESQERDQTMSREVLACCWKLQVGDPRRELCWLEEKR